MAENTDGHIRTGPEMSKSLKYAQEVTSPDDKPDHDGQTMATTSHEVIREWAEKRGATPSTVDGTEHEGRPGVLRFDFGGEGGDRVRHIEWDAWFQTFDDRGLNFIYQDKKSDGSQSNFCRLENPGREDG